MGSGLPHHQPSAQQPLGFGDERNNHGVQCLSVSHVLMLCKVLSVPSLVELFEQVPLSLSLLPLFMHEDTKA